MGKKKRVEIFDCDNGRVYERLMLSDEQIRLLEYLEENDYLMTYASSRILEEDYKFTEI